YLSCADMAVPPARTASSAAMIAITQNETLVMTHSSVVICKPTQWRSSRGAMDPLARQAIVLPGYCHNQSYLGVGDHPFLATASRDQRARRRPSTLMLPAPNATTCSRPPAMQ